MADRRCATSWMGMGCEYVPKTTTRWMFRHLLPQHDLTGVLLDEIDLHLAKRG